jgi:glycosyltransferase involved in cell wall biosynthesis
MISCTIVIPTHNRDDLLVRAVRSALQACPADGEVLVVDDKSLIPAAQVLATDADPRLRVIVNAGASGASSTRNLGVASASGEVVLFLDDDDEILPGYCERVLSPGGAAERAEWGFSSILERHPDQTTDAWRQRRRLARGPVPRGARVRDMVAAMSDGFWIRKHCFQEVGGLDPEQTIDEDTDLCIRLLAQSRWPWYEPEPGMVVFRGYAPARSSGAQLTVATPSAKGLQCYRRTHDKSAALFPSVGAFRWFLATRYLRRAVKAGRVDDALGFARCQTPWLYSIVLAMYVRIKQIKHR